MPGGFGKLFRRRFYFIAAFNFEEPDRVPLGDFWADTEAKEAFLKRPIAALQDDLDFWHQAGYDFWPLTAGLLEPAASLGKTTSSDDITKKGRKRQWANGHGGLIVRPEDLDNYPWPDPESYPIDKFEQASLILPSGMKMCLIMGKIYTAAWMLMGSDNFFGSIITNPDLIRKLFAKIADIQIRILKKLCASFDFGCLFSSDDIAFNTGPLINPVFMRKHLFPHYEEIAHICKNNKMLYVCHSDGNMWSLLDDIAALGFDGFHPVQPNVMDIKEVKKKYYKKLCLLGNLDLDFPLAKGTPEDVRAAVKDLIARAGPGGGFLLSTSNSWTSNVPTANYRAMIKATTEYGNYPIRINI